MEDDDIEKGLAYHSMAYISNDMFSQRNVHFSSIQ